MAHNTFHNQLGSAYPVFGRALWDPDPGELDPPVEVGDVGFIHEGKFHRLFNALLSGDHPSHVRYGVPENHEPLLASLSNHINRGILHPNVFQSAEVTVAPGGLQGLTAGVGSAGVSISCKKQGAVLLLPVTARREDTVLMGHFRKWITRHIESWLAFARLLQLEIEIEMDDIVLVTGCHRTKSWTNITFDDAQPDAQLSLTVEVGAFGASVDWKDSNFPVPGTTLKQGPSGTNLPENQCIFLRGFRVKRLFGKFQQLKGAAEPEPDARGSPEKETGTMPTNSVVESWDPLHILLEYIANRKPDCEMAVVHDDDLERILRLGNRTSQESLQPHSLMTYLERSKPKIDVVYDPLPTDDPSSRTDAGHLRVAMLSEQLKSLDPPSFVPVLSHLFVSTTNREKRAHCLLEALEDTTQSFGEKDGNTCVVTC